MKVQERAVKENKDRSKDLLAELRKTRGLLLLARRFATGPRVTGADAERVDMAGEPELQVTGRRKCDPQMFA